MRRFVVLLALLAMLTGCGPKEGEVVDKRWKPDLSYWGTKTECTTINNRSRCTTSPHWYYNPAQYYLILRTPEGKVREKNVKRKVYDGISVGEYYRSK
jgi:outer membrane biogenesis lipoprotein LolB